MEKCKDCINYDVCQYHIDEETDMTVNECSHGFKDKYRFIELPCKVGTTLYFLYDSPYADKPDFTPRIYETNEWYFDVDERGVSIKPRLVHGYKCVYHYYLGETVFLTREEAGEALKGVTNEQRKAD